jgi:hypothetical protein
VASTPIFQKFLNQKIDDTFLYSEYGWKLSTHYGSLKFFIFNSNDLLFGGCNQIRFQRPQHEIDLDFNYSFCPIDRHFGLFGYWKKH